MKNERPASRTLLPETGLISTSATSPGRPLLVAALLAVASIAVLPFDRPVARWCVETHWPAALERTLQLTEPVAHGIGILIIGLVVFQLDPIRRWAVPRLLLVALGSGVTADLIKVLAARVRPQHADLVRSVGEVMTGWFRAGAGLKEQSFPSGHAAAAFGLAFALSSLYPRGRWTFFALASLATCQRLVEGVHYPSDLLFGAAIGSTIAAICLYRSPIAALFDRREALWRS